MALFPKLFFLLLGGAHGLGVGQVHTTVCVGMCSNSRAVNLILYKYILCHNSDTLGEFKRSIALCAVKYAR